MIKKAFVDPRAAMVPRTEGRGLSRIDHIGEEAKNK
jgi:hypothetical protein